MCSGGVASQSDPLESLQFRMDEIEAACEEADRWGRYVAAHAYSAEAVKRAVTGGVRTIEHGNLIDREAAELMAARGAFLVPTLVAYDAMRRRAKRSEEHTSELQSLMRTSYAVFCLKKKKEH